MCRLNEKIDAEFCIIFCFLARDQDQEKRANRLSMLEMNQKLNQRLPGNSLACVVLSRLFYGLPYSSRETLEVIAAKLRKKKLLSRLLQSGRANDSLGCFEQAIALGSFPARAELALLCFNQNLAYAECKKAFQLVKEGHEFGCRDCSGILAHIYATGFRGVVTRCDETAYRLACASAAAGSCFGKMALAHFLKSLLGPIDPDEDTFYVSWTDPFIRNFASPSIDVPAPAPAAKVYFQDVSGEDEEPFKGLSGLPNEILAIILQKTRSLKSCENLYSALPIQSRAELKDVYEAHIESLNLEVWFEPDWDILSNSDIHGIARILIEEIQQEHLRNPNSPKVWRNLPAL